ncbi:C-type lectin domain family 6 member A-like, partial [Micropterus dolomieu]|uniref:C-type lectin domain family 6 member A-like n=1 Tax=Micropterus dolomieu TaxID=147949 RepID=UPI001E8CEBA4
FIVNELVLLRCFLCCFSTVTLEKDQQQTRYDKLNKNYSEQQGQLLGKCCPEGWKRFGFSCYFKFNEEKTWSDSRSDCQRKGAHLVIINNKEEQKCVTELNKDGDSWIGLQFTQQTGWKWVDDSPLTLKFWASGHPHNNYYYTAACCDKQGNWTTSRYNDQKKNWICEKELSCLS